MPEALPEHYLRESCSVLIDMHIDTLPDEATQPITVLSFLFQLQSKLFGAASDFRLGLD